MLTERELSIKTVGDLLDHAKENPTVLNRAHRAVWHAISSFGGKSPVPLSELSDVRLQNLYRDQPSKRMRFSVFEDLYGIDPFLAEVGEYFRVSSFGGEEARQMLAIGGPHGCGKTTMIRDCIANAMEDLSFYKLEGCPWHESPLHAIPKKERHDFFSHFFNFKGELCSVCEERLQGQGELSGDWRSFPVMRRRYRLSAGIGMLRVEDSLPDMDEGKFPEEWYSVFKRANGGVLFIDLSSEAQPKELRSMIGNLVADGTIRAPDQTEAHLDLAIVSVSNTHIAEEPKIGALDDRIIPIKLHLPLDVDSELKIHHRSRAYQSADSHFIPGVAEIFSKMVIASRLELSSGVSLTLSHEDAILFYAGGTKLSEDKKSLVHHSYKELREKRPFDGAKGLTVRQGRILSGKVEQYHSCIGIQHILSMLRDPAFHKGKDADIKERIKAWVVFDADSKGNYSKGKMEEWYRAYLERDLVRGWLGFKIFEDTKEKYFEDYLIHASHFLMKTKIRDKETKQEIDVDEKMLRKIEIALGVTANQEEFRSILITFFKGKVLKDHPPLHDAIERIIIDQHKEAVKAAIMQTAKEDPDKAARMLAKTRKELETHGGYNEKGCCWENVYSYAKRSMFA